MRSAEILTTSEFAIVGDIVVHRNAILKYSDRLLSGSRQPWLRDGDSIDGISFPEPTQWIAHPNRKGCSSVEAYNNAQTGLIGYRLIWWNRW